jgi:hypothetical protein
MTEPFLDTHQFDIFRDCLSAAIVERATRSSSKSKKRPRKGVKASGGKRDDQVTAHTASEPIADSEPAVTAEDLADFAEYIAIGTFESMSDELQALDHLTWSASEDLQTRYALPLTGSDAASILQSLDPSIPESLVTYGLIDGVTQGAPELLAPVLTEYVTAATAPPPPPKSTRADVEGCELCGRDWIPLTYHHLIPRFVHEKAVKRGWHRPEDLNNVAWLCRLCHSFVHRFASHEDLARHYYTVELLLKEEEVVRFAKYASRVRWKGR